MHITSLMTLYYGKSVVSFAPNWHLQTIPLKPQARFHSGEHMQQSQNFARMGDTRCANQAQSRLRLFASQDSSDQVSADLEQHDHDLSKNLLGQENASKAPSYQLDLETANAGTHHKTSPEHSNEIDNSDENKSYKLSHQTADATWNKFQDFQIKEISRLQNFDQLSIRAELVKILKSESINPFIKGNLIFAFNNLMHNLNLLKKLDIEPYLKNNNSTLISAEQSTMNKLPVPIALMTETIELYSNFERLYNQCGGQL